MKLIYAAFATLALSVTGLAQAGSSNSPFTHEDAQLMRSVWPEIRQARSFSSIDWRDVGLAGAPGDAEAHRLMAEHWSRLRQADDFRDIDWRDIHAERSSYRGDDSYGYDSDRDDARYHSRSDSRYDGRYDNTVPFTREEAEELAAVWSRIRQAADFEDINWHAEGLAHAPGDRRARRFMARHWDSLRRAANFYDINWNDVDG